jgi:hypothetical protein
MARIIMKPLQLNGLSDAQSRLQDGEIGFDTRFGTFFGKYNGTVVSSAAGPSNWKPLSTPVRVYGAEVIGAPFADYNNGRSNIGPNAVDTNPVVWSNEFGCYIPASSINKNPFKAYGAKNEFIYKEYSLHETVVGAAGFALGSAFAPVKRRRDTKTSLSFQNNASGTPVTDYYRCYYDIPIENFFCNGPSRDLNASHTTANATAYLIMTGSVCGGPDQYSRTFATVGHGANGSHSGYYNYNRILAPDVNGGQPDYPDGTNTTQYNFTQRRMYNGANTYYCGDPEVGDAQYTTGLCAIQGQDYSSGGNGMYSSYRNDFPDGYPAVGTDPVPRQNAGFNSYKASWIIPIGYIGGSMNTLRLYNWGFADLIIEGYGIAYMSKPRLA